jgi:hypothetical protein
MLFNNAGEFNYSLPILPTLESNYPITSIEYHKQLYNYNKNNNNNNYEIIAFLFLHTQMKFALDYPIVYKEIAMQALAMKPSFKHLPSHIKDPRTNQEKIISKKILAEALDLGILIKNPHLFSKDLFKAKFYILVYRARPNNIETINFLFSSAPKEFSKSYSSEYKEIAMKALFMNPSFEHLPSYMKDPKNDQEEILSKKILGEALNYNILINNQNLFNKDNKNCLLKAKFYNLVYNTQPNNYKIISFIFANATKEFTTNYPNKYKEIIIKALCNNCDIRDLPSHIKDSKNYQAGAILEKVLPIMFGIFTNLTQSYDTHTVINNNGAISCFIFCYATKEFIENHPYIYELSAMKALAMGYSIDCLPSHLKNPENQKEKELLKRILLTVSSYGADAFCDLLKFCSPDWLEEDELHEKIAYNFATSSGMYNPDYYFNNVFYNESVCKNMLTVKSESLQSFFNSFEERLSSHNNKNLMGSDKIISSLKTLCGIPGTEPELNKSLHFQLEDMLNKSQYLGSKNNQLPRER